jgi:hypothetical protein
VIYFFGQAEKMLVTFIVEQTWQQEQCHDEYVCLAWPFLAHPTFRARAIGAA